MKAILFAMLSMTALGCAARPTASNVDSARTAPTVGRATSNTAPTSIASRGKAAPHYVKTAGLISDAAVAGLVDALAAENAYESSAIGYGGEPSKVYARFEALVSKASDTQLLSLLRHESPTVRVYAAIHVVDALPSHMADLEPLLHDEAHLASQIGCIGNDQNSVSRLTVEALRSSPLPEAKALLARAQSAP